MPVCRQSGVGERLGAGGDDVAGGLAARLASGTRIAAGTRVARAAFLSVRGFFSSAGREGVLRLAALGCVDTSALPRCPHIPECLDSVGGTGRGESCVRAAGRRAYGLQGVVRRGCGVSRVRTPESGRQTACLATVACRVANSAGGRPPGPRNAAGPQPWCRDRRARRSPLHVS